MDWKEFFRPTNWKLFLSVIPILTTLISYFLNTSILEDFFTESIAHGLYLTTLAMLFPPLGYLFCKFNLANSCYGFMAFPEITLIGSILLGIIHGIIVYIIYSLIVIISKKFINKKFFPKSDSSN